MWYFYIRIFAKAFKMYLFDPASGLLYSNGILITAKLKGSLVSYVPSKSTSPVSYNQNLMYNIGI